MASTAGFELLLQLSRPFLQGVLNSERLRASAAIPKTVQLIDPANPPSLGPLVVDDALLNLEQLAVQVELDPDTNRLGLVSHQAEVQLTFPNEVMVLLEVMGTLAISVPLQILELEDDDDDDGLAIGIDLGAITTDDVELTLDKGHPLEDPKLLRTFVENIIHAAYAGEKIEPEITVNAGFSPLLESDSVLVTVTIYDDSGGETERQIIVTNTEHGLKISVPIYALFEPPFPATNDPDAETIAFAFDCTARLTFEISPILDLDTPPATIGLGPVTVGVEDIVHGFNYAPQEGDDPNDEWNIDLEPAFTQSVSNALLSIADNAVSTLRLVFSESVSVPSTVEIESLVVDGLVDFFAGVGTATIPFWAPQSVVAHVDDVAAKVVSTDTIAVAVNAGPNADLEAIESMIPPGLAFALVFSSEALIDKINELKFVPQDEGGIGLPLTHGKTRVKDIRPAVGDGYIRVDGDFQRIIAVLPDIHGTFSNARVVLEWRDDDEGNQEIAAELINNPSLDTNLPDWVDAIIAGLVLLLGGGLVGVGIAVAVLQAIKAVIERSTGNAVSDAVGGLSTGALPTNLADFAMISSRFENPITISPDVIVLAGSATVTSAFEGDDAHARAGGPYDVLAVEPLELAGGRLAPSTTYAWSFGDGLTGLGADASHTYAASGLYAAKLTSNDAQRGPDAVVKSSHYALVRVENRPPVAHLGDSITIDEGEEIELVATFTDIESSDTHRAKFFFGDGTRPVTGIIEETNEPPIARGTARARHAYCDDGTYHAKVQVFDDDGGIGEDSITVTVRNVGPSVDAGKSMYAYPCTPLRMVARFTDPGWCDTYEATWDFGDCEQPTPRAAVVYHTDEPPMARGIAVATHCYMRCGTYVATATVMDDDGGVGIDTTRVRVVDLCNGDFEGGFHEHGAGSVANHWRAYVGASSTYAALEGIFACEECLVSEGQRSQRISTGGHEYAGIHQTIGANRSWSYEFGVSYHLSHGGSGTFRMGVDPLGGTNPGAAHIVWVEAEHHDQWLHLAVSTVAEADAITVFLEHHGTSGSVCVDGATVVPHPCGLDPKEWLGGGSVCVDWRATEPHVVGPSYRTRGLTFTSMDGQAMALVDYGSPPGQTKLEIPYQAREAGVRVDLPFPATVVTATVSGAGIQLVAVDQHGRELATAQSAMSTLTTLETEASGIVAVLLTGTTRPLLVELCVHGQAEETLAPPTTLVYGGEHS